MQYFQNCPECELIVLIMMAVGWGITYLIANYISCKKRRWGCNHPDAKYVKNKNGHI